MWLRKVVVTHEKILGEEELQPEDLFSFEKTQELIDHAVFVKKQLYLKSENQIQIANEGVIPFPKNLQFKTNFVYGSENGLKCLGQLEGITQSISIFERQVTPDPNAQGIAFYLYYAVTIYPNMVHYEAEKKGYLNKKEISKLTKGLHNCAIGYRDLF